MQSRDNKIQISYNMVYINLNLSAIKTIERTLKRKEMPKDEAAN